VNWSEPRTDVMRSYINAFVSKPKEIPQFPLQGRQPSTTAEYRPAITPATPAHADATPQSPSPQTPPLPVTTPQPLLAAPLLLPSSPNLPSKSIDRTRPTLPTALSTTPPMLQGSPSSLPREPPLATPPTAPNDTSQLAADLSKLIQGLPPLLFLTSTITLSTEQIRHIQFRAMTPPSLSSYSPSPNAKGPRLPDYWATDSDWEAVRIFTVPTNLPPGGMAPPGLIQTAAKRVWLSLNHVPPPPYQIPMSTRDTTTATHQQPQPQRDNSGSSSALTQRQKKRLRYKRNKQQKRGLPVEAPPSQNTPTLPTPALPGPTLTHVAPLPATEAPSPLPVSRREGVSPTRLIRRPASGMLRLLFF